MVSPLARPLLLPILPLFIRSCLFGISVRLIFVCSHIYHSNLCQRCSIRVEHGISLLHGVGCKFIKKVQKSVSSTSAKEREYTVKSRRGFREEPLN